MRLRSLFPVVAVMAAPLALAACSRPAPLSVDQAEVRLNANPAAPAAGYLVLHGGGQPVTLLRVVADHADRVELHESAMENGMMRMKALDGVAVPAHGTVAFAQGGKHLMIFDIAPAAVQGGKLKLTLLFSDGERLSVEAPVRKAGTGDAATAGGMMDHGAMAPSTMDHAAMNHAAMPAHAEH